MVHGEEKLLLKLHEQTPQKRILGIVEEGLTRGDILIIPTDTVYALVCSADHPRAINDLYKIKGISESQHLSLLCRDVAMASNYAYGISDQVFRFMKNVTPGPYTFIFKANRNMDRRGTGKRKQVGIRIVDHPLHRLLMEQLDTPLVSTSLTTDDEFHTDPEDLERLYGRHVAAVVDAGVLPLTYSTVLDCSEGDFRLIRRGKGDIESIDIVEDLSANEE